MRAVGDVFSPSWIESDRNKRKLRIEYTIECISLAKKLGANMITTEPGGLISNASDISEIEKDFVDGLNEVIPVAERENVKVLIDKYYWFLANIKRYINKTDTSNIVLSIVLLWVTCRPSKYIKQRITLFLH